MFFFGWHKLSHYIHFGFRQTTNYYFLATYSHDFDGKEISLFSLFIKTYFISQFREAVSSVVRFQYDSQGNSKSAVIAFILACATAIADANLFYLDSGLGTIGNDGDISRKGKKEGIRPFVYEVWFIPFVCTNGSRNSILFNADLQQCICTSGKYCIHCNFNYIKL